MTNVVAERATFGVLIPSTNTVVEADYNRMRPPGVTYHAGRCRVTNPSLADSAAVEAFLGQLEASMAEAVGSLLTCKPDYIIMGMSAETFWGGADGTEKFEKWMYELTGLGVSTGATACREAMERYGAKRLAVITPYQPIGDEQVHKFFTDLGFEVARVVGLGCPDATSIAEVPAEEVRRAYLEADSDDVDALIQAGTNLSGVDVAADLERELGKPVVAINTACVWHGLRAMGIDDKLPGFGSLLAEH